MKSSSNSGFWRYKSKYYGNLTRLLDKISANTKIDNITTTESNDIDITIENTTPELHLCQICKEKEFNYTCPKCKTLYCSKDCYANHNSECTEEFYKNNVISELKALKVSEEEAHKFGRNLREWYQRPEMAISNETNNEYDNTANNKEVDHYEELLEKINTGNINIENDWTPDDWKSFTRFINSGSDDKYGETVWAYWERVDIGTFDIIDIDKYGSWNSEDRKQLIEININTYKEYINAKTKDSAAEEKEEDSCDMEGIKTIRVNNEEIVLDYTVINTSITLKYIDTKALNSIAKTKANPNNIYQIVSILFTSVYLYRWFNGDYDDSDWSEDIIKYLIYLSPCLFNTVTPETQPNSLSSVSTNFFTLLKEIEKSYWKETKRIVIQDIKLIFTLNVKFIAFESMVRVYELLHLYTITNKSRKEIVKAKYKIIYLMSFLKSSYTSEIINRLKEEVNTI